MKAQPVTIVLKDDSKYHILTRITPRADGGFTVMAPPHRAEEGFLLKTKKDKRDDASGNAANELRVEQKERYRTADRIALVFEADGSLYFISENLNKALSTTNVAGEISGLKIIREALSKAVVSSAFSMLAWGLSEFEECIDLDSPSHGHVLNYCRPDLYNRGHLPTGRPNGIVIEGRLFHAGVWEAVQGESPELHLDVAFRKRQLGFATINVRVVPLDNPNVFLGIFANHIPISPPSLTGFHLFAPGGADECGLVAAYPEPGDALIKVSLDFKRAKTEG